MVCILIVLYTIIILLYLAFNRILNVLSLKVGKHFLQPHAIVYCKAHLLLLISLFFFNLSLCRTLMNLLLFCALTHTHILQCIRCVCILSALNRHLKAFVFHRLTTKSDPFCLPTAFYSKTYLAKNLGRKYFCDSRHYKRRSFYCFSSALLLSTILNVVFDSVILIH